MKVSKISKLRKFIITEALKDKVHLSMLFKHWVLLFYVCLIATLFVYFTFDDPSDIWLTNIKERTTAKFAYVFMSLIQSNFSQ